MQSQTSFYSQIHFQLLFVFWLLIPNPGLLLLHLIIEILHHVKGHVQWRFVVFDHLIIGYHAFSLIVCTIPSPTRDSIYIEVTSQINSNNNSPPIIPNVEKENPFEDPSINSLINRGIPNPAIVDSIENNNPTANIFLWISGFPYILK